MLTMFCLEYPKRREHLEDLDIDNIEMDLREIEWKYVKRIRLYQNRYQWRVLVNTVMNFLVP
jgi:hypothetical protein